jgi:3-oxoacyl-[acyl-carrier-protein] synthase II
MGALSPLGNSVEELWSGLVTGRSGIGPITLFDPSEFPSVIAGEVRDFDFTNFVNSKESRRMARFSQLAVAAAIMAVQDSKLDIENMDRERFGVVMGAGNGSVPTIQENCEIMAARGGMRINPFFMPMILPNMAAANIAKHFGAKGYNNTVTTACAASTQSIGEAAEAIRRGAAEVIITGGTEAQISEVGLAGFCILKALSTKNDEPAKASRPFDVDRDGFVPSEGAAVLIIERLDHALDRGANILAEILGFAACSDAYHVVQPEENGEGASRAMRWTLENAGISANEVDYINAHGTSTPINDIVETRAIKTIFGDRSNKVPISSSKSMVGHVLGASGAMEAIACIKTIVEGYIHPTINLDNPDPECDLDYVPNVGRRQSVDTVLSNSFGFGGQNACLIFRRYRE